MLCPSPLVVYWHFSLTIHVTRHEHRLEAEFYHRLLTVQRNEQITEQGNDRTCKRTRISGRVCSVRTCIHVIRSAQIYTHRGMQRKKCARTGMKCRNGKWMDKRVRTSPTLLSTPAFIDGLGVGGRASVQLHCKYGPGE